MGDFWERRVDQALFVGFCFLVFSVPLVFSPLTHQVFSLSKVTLLRVGSLILLSFWLVKFLLSSSVEIKRSPFDLPVLIFVTLAFFSLIFSVHFPTSLFGKYGRYEGFLTLLNYALLYFLALQTGWDENRLKILGYSMVAGASLISLYGVVQYFGYDFFPWGLFGEQRQSFSTTGNPNNLASYLAIALPISLSLTLSAQRGKRLLFGGATILLFFCLLTTFTRGGWLAAGGALFVLAFLLRSRLKRELKVLGAVISLLVVVVVLLGIFSAKSNTITNLFARAASVVKIGEGTIANRFEIWKGAWDMTRMRPVLGWGPDTFALVYHRYATLKFTQLTGYSSLADQAHNYPLQLSSSLGIPAAALFLFIVGLFGWRGWKIFRGNPFGKKEDSQRHLFLAGIIAAGFGYFISVLFTVNIVANAFLFWIFLGLVAQAGGDHPKVHLHWGEGSYRLRGLSFLLMVGAIIYLIGGSLLFYLADAHYREARKLSANANIPVAIEGIVSREYETAIRFNPYVDDYPRHAGRFYLKQTEHLDDFQQALGFLEEAQKKSPLDLNNYISLGGGYRFGGYYFGDQYYQKAILVLNQALQLYPNSPVFHRQLGLVYRDLGDHKKARREFKLAIRYDPNYAKAYADLGVCYQMTKETKKAIRAFEEALRLDPALESVQKALRALKSSK